MQKSPEDLDLSEIEIDRAAFDLSHASILLEPARPDQNSQAKKSTENDTANIETRCGGNEQPNLGSIMRDLEKFERQQSYDSEVYDIYLASGPSDSSGYRNRAKEIIAGSSRHALREVGEYIFDFSKPKLSRHKKPSMAKLKNGGGQPKSPKPTGLKQHRQSKNNEPCHQYYGFETPRSQKPLIRKKKKSSDGITTKQKSLSKRILFDSEEKRSTSKFSLRGSTIGRKP